MHARCSSVVSRQINNEKPKKNLNRLISGSLILQLNRRDDTI